MTVGELTAREIERVHWDVIVVGTGMGGGLLGYRLARAGRRVLFVEKGRSTLPGAPDTIRAAMPELAEPGAVRSATDYLAALARAGRTTDELTDVSGRRPKRFIPFIGSGTGGSSALYGMVCERFFPQDFTPRQYFPNAGDSSVPEAWPIGYDELAPWYDEAERLLGVRGQRDPLRSGATAAALPEPPPFSPENRVLVDYFTGRGLHPYHLPMACRYVPGCRTCQTFLCDRSCKNDAATAGVLPAVTEHGATLLTESPVLRLEADRRSVQRVICRHRGTTLALRGRVVVLAAGALATPVLLLNSRSGDWPNGLANGSDLVGRNLMRHLLEPVEVWPEPGTRTTEANKQIGLNDFYLYQGRKYGTVQSFGALPPLEWLTNRPGAAGAALRLLRPAVRAVYERFFTGGLVLAGIMEDLPYPDNRVLPGRTDPDGRQRIRLNYRLRPAELERREVFVGLLRDLLRPFRTVSLGNGRDNKNLGHVCGTCRFGTDPATSVLDPNNRAHEVDNLYVVDTSFFPSSAGLNPSLTVAANALRVGAHIETAHFPG
ncbi:GMC family oxidoreductase [uncultured Mycolicibacterium sp.]|uniref:GMC oxidoreductase n=1 Tax=uncultured Mycolicibacterium sp. TaxID=2320817 RepID=UPI00261CC48B|nr:GMC family oxidoreductase [uncultured Mycolicibacterium sp.]